MVTTAVMTNQAQDRPPGRAVIDWADERTRVVRLVGQLDWITAGGLRQLLSGPCDEEAVIVFLDPGASIEQSEAELLLTAVSHAQVTGTPFAIVSPDHSLTDTLYASDLGFTVPVVRTIDAALRITAAHQARLTRLHSVVA